MNRLLLSKSQNLVNKIKFVKQVSSNFEKHECALRAASLAYYTLFSIFPLLLLVVYLGGEYLSTRTALNTLELFFEQFFPGNSDELGIIIEQILLVRGPIGIIGAVGLLWSASSVFGVLEWSLSIIWNRTPSNFWRRRFLGGIAVLVLSLLFLASISLRPLTDWLWQDDGLYYKDILSVSFSITLTSALSFLLFRIFPNRNVAWKPALAGALLVSVSIELTRLIVGYYLLLAFENLGYIYGSLAWIIAMAIWVYIVGILFFLGAEFGATLEEQGWI